MALSFLVLGAPMGLLGSTREREALPERPKAIRLVLTIRYPTTQGNETPGTEYRYLETDLAFAGRSDAWASDCVPIVRAQTLLTTQALAARIEGAFLRSSDPERVRRFREDARELATSVLGYAQEEQLAVRAQGAAQAALEGLVREYERGVTVRIGPDGKTEVTVDGPDRSQ